MKNIFIITISLFLGSCGSGGGGSDGGNGQPIAASPPVAATSQGTITYATSQLLADNSARQIFQVLLMGNSHAIGLQSILQAVISHGQPERAVDVVVAPGSKFLADRQGDGVSEQALEGNSWSHIIFQAQKYSSTGTNSYPTTAAEYWIRGAKELGATPILFPEHPRRGNAWEGQTLYELHRSIAQKENACVAPVGLVWDEVLFREPSLVLHQPDGNHASETGLFLTALVFYQIVTGQTADSVSTIPGIGIDQATQQRLKESVSSVLFLYPPCFYGT
jgi:hypothetical protein